MQAKNDSPIFPISYLSEDGITVVGKDYAAHGVEEHLEHALWSESCADDVRHGLHAKIFVIPDC